MGTRQQNKRQKRIRLSIMYIVLVVLLIAAIYTVRALSYRQESQACEAVQQPLSVYTPSLHSDPEVQNPYEYYPVYLGDFLCTAYCSCSVCCGQYADGITSTGTLARSSHTIAVDPSVIPYGSHVAVYYEDGEYSTYVAEDCGSAIQGNHIDVFYDTHEEAQLHGKRMAQIYLLED